MLLADVLCFRRWPKTYIPPIPPYFCTWLCRDSALTLARRPHPDSHRPSAWLVARTIDRSRHHFGYLSETRTRYRHGTVLCKTTLCDSEKVTHADRLLIMRIPPPAWRPRRTRNRSRHRRTLDGIRPTAWLWLARHAVAPRRIRRLGVRPGPLHFPRNGTRPRYRPS